MRLLLAAALATISSPAFAQTACPLKHAISAGGENGYELRFHPGKPWEMGGMTESVFDLAMPDGRRLWGNIASNMGTSRDVGRMYDSCPSPTADADILTEEEHDACRQWEGVVYSLIGGEPGFIPYQDDPAPGRLLMTDLGRKIRYSMVDRRGQEPWDVFDLKRCT